MELETVATFDTLGAAEAARNLLESEGIRAQVDSNRVLRNPFRNDPHKPVALQVAAEHAERARQLLD